MTILNKNVHVNNAQRNNALISTKYASSTHVVVLDGYLIVIVFDEAMGSATDV